MAIIKIKNQAIDLDAAEIPNIDASKITSGSIASARLGNIDLTNLSATNLTSGTIPDARVSSSAVSQHATSFDDNAIVNDLSTIALRQATNENAIAYNTNSSFVDVFQDSSGIASNTNAPRNTNEFVSTVIETFGTTANIDSYMNDSSRIAMGMASQYGTMPASLFDGSTSGGMIYWGGGDTSPVPSSGIPQFTTKTYNKASNGTTTHYGLFFDFMGNSGSMKALVSGSHINWYSYLTDGRINGHYWVYQDANDTWYQWLGTGTSSTSGTWTSGNILNAPNANNWNGISHPSSLGNIPVKALALITTSHHSNANNYPAITELEVNVADYNLTANATGNFIGNTITAGSSTSSMGAIITYQDQAGTNALNTDIILQLSADNGSNFTTATLTALPNYSTGIKMAKVNDLSVTAGTQLKYKISFANQSGSKQARIRGVSLQY